MTEPVLHVAQPRGDTRAVALVLHGGRAHSTESVRAHHLPVVRMAPFARSLRTAGSRHGLAIARLRFGVRGWNGELRSPVADVNGALATLSTDFPGHPIALVGHSMGGRSAFYAAGHDAVQAVVGLAPWFESGDPSTQLSGRHVLVLHGTRDRVTSARASAAYVTALQGVARSASYVSIHGESHAMLRRAAVWHEITTGYVLGSLCGVAPADTVRPDLANVVEKALAGSPYLEV